MLPLVVLILFGTTQMLLAAPAPQWPGPQWTGVTGEIKNFQQIGDKIRGEYSRLHPDGSVTKTVAFGDTKQGLQYKTLQMDPLGNVRTIDMPNQQSQLSQGSQQQQQNQPAQTPNMQLSNQPAAQNPATPQQGSVPPGVNWFMQQPQVGPVAPGLDPFGTDSLIQALAATDPFLQPLAQEPLLTNPLLNLWNF